MLITLTTDFGYQDAFVGIMKGMILGINPQACIVDLTHGIAPQNILAGALALRHAIDYFPADTIHVTVVDPGVGSARRPLLIEAGNGYFIGPDNGIFSLTLANKPALRIIELSNPRYHRQPTSATFHGRDIFAPVAAHLSLGIPPENFGPRLDSIADLSLPKTIRGECELTGEIVYIDGFGNLFTNIGRHDLTGVPVDRLVVRCGTFSIVGLAESYASASVGEFIALINSWGVLEVAVRNGSAQRVAGLDVRDRVVLTWDR